MAYLDTILTIDNLLQTETITAGNAGTAVAIAERKLFAVSIDRLCYIKQGDSTVTAAATDILLPSAGIYTFFRNKAFTYISIFAPAGTDAITSVFELANN